MNIQLELSQRPPMPRCWFLNAAGTEILHFQSDRFVHNWRKVGEGAEYPRYERIRRTFLTELDKLARFMWRETDQDLVPNQCEITYVNQIPDFGNVPGTANQSLAVWHAPEDFPAGNPEDVSLQARFVLGDEE